MKALILNSGIGSRIERFTQFHPKCMIELYKDETILSRQLKWLIDMGIGEVVITTGFLAENLIKYCHSLGLPIKYNFVCNSKYNKTNYIYSIYCAREYLKDDDIILMHGDLVFEPQILDAMIELPYSCMAVSTTEELPEKDFKAVINKGNIVKIGTEFFEHAVSAQPLYKFLQKDWLAWLDKISEYCENSITNCYAEAAFNDISNCIKLKPYDFMNALCKEVDTEDDLLEICQKVKIAKERVVYMGFATDIIHSGHIAILKKAARLGKVIVGILSDNVVASYKRFPLIPYEERKALLDNLKEVYQVVEQKELSYRENILEIRPDYVVHGDEWKEGTLKGIRAEVIEILQTYGGKLIEFPYTENEKLIKIEQRMLDELSIPDFRRGRLKRAIEMKGCINAIEVHNGITGLIAEKSKIEAEGGKIYQFDAMWVSSLCDSTAKGKPDIELVDTTSRFRTIDDIMEVTTKPIIFDGDTGGLIEHFVYTVKSLERMGVSMIIIEDKIGLKKNSLFGAEVEQTQDSIEHFCAKIEAGEKAKRTNDFMIVARVESLILEKGMSDALTRADAYVKAGVDGIMIHSRKKEPDEIFEFVDTFRLTDKVTPIVVVPTTFNTVTEEVFQSHGINVVIYANQLTRSSFPAMQHTANLILQNHRAKEADELCMPIKDIINLIPINE